MRLKVVTIVGTRPEIIRLSRVITRLDQDCEHLLVHTGQNYDHELSGIFFDGLGLRAPDAYLDCAGGSPLDTIGKVVSRTYDFLSSEMPDAVLVLGDTNSCLAVLSAKRLKIPTFHMEAGNRCFDQRVPEEINRKIVDHTSDINLPYSRIARDYLLREGVDPQMVIVTGSPMREVVEAYRDPSIDDHVLGENGLEPQRYFIASLHREENVSDHARLAQFLEVLQAVQRKYGQPILVSTHPRTRSALDSLVGGYPDSIKFVPPFGFPEYLTLQANARAVLSDSGTITEESAIMKFPALNMRDTHERPEGMEEGAVMLCGNSVDRVMQCLQVLDRRRSEGAMWPPDVADYQSSDVSEKVVTIIHSYVDVVNRLVWRR